MEMNPKRRSIATGMHYEMAKEGQEIMKRRQRILAMLLSLVVTASYSVPALAMETASGNSSTAASTKITQDVSSENSTATASEGKKDTAANTAKADSNASEESDASAESSETSGDSEDIQSDSQVTSDHTHQWAQVTEVEEKWDGNTLVTPQVTAQKCSICGANKFESRRISASASADGGIYWSVTEAGSMEVYRGLGSDGKMPENPSWQVKTEWFDYTQNLKKVEIQSTVTSISPEAFYGCKNLTSVTIREGVTEIGYGAFCWCPQLSEINIPEGITKIPQSCFNSCSSLKKIQLPSTMTTIGEFAFTNTGLTEISIPEGVETIEMNAFSACNDLKVITIPSTVNAVGQNAMRDCTSLTKVNIASNQAQFGSNVFANCDQVVLYFDCDNIAVKNYAEGESLEYILSHDWEADYTIDQEPESNDSGELTKAGIRSIHCKRYNVCGKVKDTIKYGKTGTVGWELTEDGTLTVTGEGTISSKPSWTTVKSEVDFANDIQNVIIEDGITGIGSYAFMLHKKLESVRIPNSVTSIGMLAFNDCYSLKEVQLPDDLTTIQGGTFYDCTSLEKIELPKNLTAIDAKAFSGCSSLQEITIPSLVTKLGNSAFSQCEKLEKITIDGKNIVYGSNLFKDSDNVVIHCDCDNRNARSYADDNDVKISYEHSWDEGTVTKAATCTENGVRKYTCTICGDTKKEVIPALGGEHRWAEEYTVDQEATETSYGIKSIHCTRTGCSATKDPVEFIARGTDDSTGIQWEIDVEGILTINGSGNATMASYYQNCGPWASYKDRIQKVDIHLDTEEATTIPKECFMDYSNLESVSIQGNVSKLCRKAFQGCSKLEKVTLPEGMTEFEDGVFIMCNSLKEIEIPSTVTTIGASSFYMCRSLEKINIPEGVKTIGIMTFAWCDNLKYVTLPKSLETIGNSAFYDCKSLEKITIPEGVKTLGNGVFSLNRALKDIIVDGHSLESFGTNVFGTCTANPILYCECDNTVAIELAEDNKLTTELRHDWDDQYTVDKEPTCTQEGSESKHCTRTGCDAITDSQVVAALGHDWNEGVVTKNPTCQEKGLKEYTCNRCGETKTEELDVADHSWTHYRKAAGLLRNGTEYDICSVCKLKKNVKTLKGYAKYVIKKYKVKKGKKSFTAKWKKAGKSTRKQMSGYQVRYSVKSNMKNAKYAKAKTTSKGKKIKKLKAKTKYYVQVRTYKKKGGITYYSKWSGKKTVKTK